MSQDVNKIIDVVSAEWAGGQSQSIKKIAILSEQNERLKKEIEKLKEEVSELKSDKEEDK